MNRLVAASCQREMIARYLAVLCAFRLSILPILECDSNLSVEIWKAAVLAHVGAAFVLGMTLNGHMSLAFIDHC